jgi:uncharacterized membrane protein
VNWSEIILAPVFPWWLIFIFLAVGVAFLLLHFRLIRRRLSLGRRIALILLRLSAVSLLILLALNPSWVVKREVGISPSLAVLFDTSPSMGLLVTSGKGSRMDEARAFLLDGPNPLLKSLAEKFDLRLYAVGDSLRTLKPEELAGLKTGEGKGNLKEALKELRGKNTLALLLSDGGLEWGASDSSDIPVFTLPLGDPKGYKDLMIRALKAPALAFRGREVTVEVAVKSYGYRGLRHPVALKEREKVLTVKELRLDDRTGEGSLSLSFIPQEIGSHTLAVSIPPQLGESLTSNNQASFPLKVVRDKIRILMVTGSPSMNYRFLRMALKNDPSIDLLSFVILRTPSNILNVPLQEQSLIPFPVETLFDKELKSFDLVIFDNFLSQPYFRPNYLERVREFVKGGGSFAVIGGPNFYGEGGYSGTAVEEILPVRWAGREGYRRASPLRVKLSRSGSLHPVTRLSSVGEENRRLWEEMPPLDGVNLLRPKSSGTVLLESADGNGWPILTLGGYGKGRVLVLATDSAWKWYMGTVAEGKGPWAYQRLTERLVRWLTRDPDLDPVQITLPEETGRTGREMDLRVKVQKDSLFKKSEGGISVTVVTPEGARIGSRIKPGDRGGEYLVSFLPEEEGTYRVKVETQGEQREEFVFIGKPLQNWDGFPDHEHLRRISASTQGRTLLPGESLLKELEDYGKKAQKRFLEESRFPLGGNGYIFFLLTGLLTTEWYLRRRWGLI